MSVHVSKDLSIILSDSRFKSCVVELSSCFNLACQEVSGWPSYHRVPPSVSESGSLGPLQTGHCFSLTVDWLHSARLHTKN